jgi:hypothetical protein
VTNKNVDFGFGKEREVRDMKGDYRAILAKLDDWKTRTRTTVVIEHCSIKILLPF